MMEEIFMDVLNFLIILVICGITWALGYLTWIFARWFDCWFLKKFRKTFRGQKRDLNYPFPSPGKEDGHR